MGIRMGDSGLSPLCYRDVRLGHQNCNAQLANAQKIGDNYWCACECHGTRTRSGSQTDRQRYDAWKSHYDRLLGSAGDVP